MVLPAVELPSNLRSNRGRMREVSGIPPPTPRRVADPERRNDGEGKLLQFDEFCDDGAGVSPMGLKAVAPGPVTA